MIELTPAQNLSLQDVHAVARKRATVVVSDECRAAVRASHEFMKDEASAGRPIYGVTTGFGPLANQHLHPDAADELQKNLIYHLATGVGEPFSPAVTRAIMLARLAALTRGYSAVSETTVELVEACLNRGLTPVVPSLGTVGASGDLTPLAHVALALMGEGEFWEGDLDDESLEPLRPSARECLGLVNGTSAMTGLAALNGVDAMRAWDVGLALAAVNAELFEARSEAFDDLVGMVRPHAGQRATLDRLREFLSESTRLRDNPKELELASLRDEPNEVESALQDPYTVRCIPQVFGAIHDVIAQHNNTVETELNSVTDNPLFDPQSRKVVHGGNFMGQHVSFASDSLNNALVQLAVHAERVVARVCDPRRNGGLPAFLTGATVGLHSGFMGAQVTSTALVAELRTHAGAASIQSIATNADNQDIVSMGTISALRTHRSLDRLFEVLAVEALVLTQAMELSGGSFSPAAESLALTVRRVSPPLTSDRPLSSDITTVANTLRL